MSYADEYAKSCGYADASSMVKMLTEDARGHSSMGTSIRAMIEESVIRALRIIDAGNEPESRP